MILDKSTATAHSIASFAKGKVLQQKMDIIKLCSRNIPLSTALNFEL